MEIDDRVEVKQYIEKDWVWADPKGRLLRGYVTAMDKHCLTVCTDGGEIIRAVRDHFRRPRQ